MTEKSRYSYEKRIEDLERHNLDLADRHAKLYNTTMEIFDGVQQCAEKGTGINLGWLIAKYRRFIR
jgi:prefoldin subunit 5